MTDNKVPKSAGVKRKPPGGSRKGCPNKTTRALKEMVLAALDTAGGEAFLVRQAKKKNNAPFMALLAKVLPMQVTGEDGGPLEFRVKAMSDEQLLEVIRKAVAGDK